MKVAFGGSTIKRSSNTGEPLGLADGLKAAATDARSMVEQDEREENMSSSLGTPSALIDRQLRAIVAVSRALGWSPDSVRQHALDAFGVPPDELTKMDASVFIGELQQMNTKEAA